MENIKTVVSLALTLTLIATVLSAAFLGTESHNEIPDYTQLWILGNDEKATDYPYNLNATNDFSCLFLVGVRNRSGHDADFLLRAKLANQTDVLPNRANSTTNNIASVYEFEFSLVNNESLETRVDVQIPEHAFFTIEEDTLNLTAIAINGKLISGLDIVLARSITAHGYPFLIFFELWIYETTLQKFSYENRFVSLWLNFQT